MNILLALIPMSLLLLLAAVAAFLWAVKGGQFDDLDTPALDMLRDDDRPAPPPGAGSTPPPGAGTATSPGTAGAPPTDAASR